MEGGGEVLAKILIAATRIKSFFGKLVEGFRFVFPHFLHEIHFINILVILEMYMTRNLAKPISSSHVRYNCC